MAPDVLEIDPEGDLIIEIPDVVRTASKVLDEQAGGGGDEPDIDRTPESVAIASNGSTRRILHFRVSTKHLELASARAKTMFLLPFVESKKDEETGLCKWTFEALFDTIAFQIVLSIIHGHTRLVPERVSVRLLAEVSAVVDDLQCRDAVWFFAKKWLRDLDGELPGEVSPELFDWIFIASIFQEPIIFKATTRVAIRTMISPVGDIRPPVAATIIEDIQQHREKLFRYLFEALNSKIDELRYGLQSCPTACTYTLLGALVRQMTSVSVFNATESQALETSGESIDSIMKKIRSFHSPPVFVSGEVGVGWDARYVRQQSDDGYGFKASNRLKKARALGSYDQVKPAVDLPWSVAHHNCTLNTHMQRILEDLESSIHGLELQKYIT